jgi:hypothetical protein
MAVSRRTFLSTAAGLPLATLLGKALELPLASFACVLPESQAGFTRAMVGLSARNVTVFPAAGGFDPRVVEQISKGRLVIFECGAGFLDPRAFREQRTGMARAFGLTLEPPVDLWSLSPRPSYLELAWPVHARLRDFSSAVAVRGVEPIGSISGLPVAAIVRARAGQLLFLGSPVGPALWSGDPQAHTWLRAVLATAAASSAMG